MIVNIEMLTAIALWCGQPQKTVAPRQYSLQGYHAINDNKAKIECQKKLLACVNKNSFSWGDCFLEMKQ